MPALTSGKALVTGANGYIAVWVVQKLLDAGFDVRGTVRSEDKAVHLREQFKSVGSRFEVVIVEDITKEGAFDEAVKDIALIEHTASPFHSRADDPDELIVPAVQGTLSILRSALKAGSPELRRIVITASCATVLTPLPLPGQPQWDAPRKFSEADWNTASIEEVEKLGRGAHPMNKYRTSKTLAERAAWDLYAKAKADVAWDLVVLNPPYVFGPAIHAVGERPEDLNESARDWWETVVRGGKLDNAQLATVGSCYVDVRDLAQAHVLAATTPEAGGERIIISAGTFKWQDFISAGHAYIPTIQAGNTEYAPEKAVHWLQYDTAKEQRILKLKHHSLEQMTRDTLDDFKARGWL